MEGSAAAVPGPDAPAATHQNAPDSLRLPSNVGIGGLSPRRSVRVRPTEQLARQNTGPRAPLRNPEAPAIKPPAPELQQRPSKMSLFSLFSKPKVERLRGHVEQGLPSHRSAMDLRTAAKQEAAAAAAAARAEEASPALPPTSRSRPFTARSLTSRTSRATLREQSRAHTPSAQLPQPPPPQPVTSAAAAAPSSTVPLPSARSKDAKPSNGEPVPLFQAWPQAIKHAVLEVSNVTSEMLLQQSRHRVSTGQSTLQRDSSSRGSNEDPVAGEDGQLTPINATAAPILSRSLKHVSRSSLTSIDLPKKLLILSTSGCLLQYSETGNSDRLPEKVLQLGKESAAFACDLIPGKHHVLEILQSVGELAGSTNNQGSILQKFGIRSAAARRQTSNLLVVMPDAGAMALWMSAVRKQIQILGGKRARSDSVTERPKTGAGEAPKIDLKHMPSQSHRYQVRRDPSRVSVIVSPSMNAPDGNTVESASPSPVKSTVTVKSDEPKPMELSAGGKTISTNDTTARSRGNSDSDSLSSSDAPSVDQHHLDHLRESTRMSHTSTANTLATSRTSSLTSSPPTEHPLIGLDDASREGGLGKTPYRSLSSYSLSSKRRSILPTKEAPSSPESKSPQLILIPPRRLMMGGSIDSPVLGHHAALPESLIRQRLSSMQSAPDLKAIAEIREKQEGQADEARRLSFVAELPAPTWATTPSLNTRLTPLETSLAAMEEDTALPQLPVISPRRTSVMMDPSRMKRTSSQSFSLPLKINTSDVPQSRFSSRSPRSPRSSGDDENLISPIAAVHTLTAKVDPSTQTTIPPSHIPPRRSSNSGLDGSIGGRRTTARLSLFPSPLPLSPTHADPLRRSPSAAALMSLAKEQALPSPTSQTLPASLRRPISLQVRSDHAPFLASVRNPAQTNPPQQLPGVPRTAMPMPIRSLKPSRSSIISPPAGYPLAGEKPGYGARRESLLHGPLIRPLSSFSSPNLSLLAQETTEQSASQADSADQPAAPSNLQAMQPVVSPSLTEMPERITVSPPVQFTAQSTMSPVSPSSLPPTPPPNMPLPAPPAMPQAATSSPASAPPMTVRTPSRLRKSMRPMPRGALPEIDFGIPVVGLGPPAPPPSAPLPELPGMASRKPSTSSSPATAPIGPAMVPSRTPSSETSPVTPMTPPHLPLAGLGIQVGSS